MFTKRLCGKPGTPQSIRFHFDLSGSDGPFGSISLFQNLHGLFRINPLLIKQITLETIQGVDLFLDGVFLGS